jgi:hypothetical protein
MNASPAAAARHRPTTNSAMAVHPIDTIRNVTYMPC